MILTTQLIFSLISATGGWGQRPVAAAWCNAALLHRGGAASKWPYWEELLRSCWMVRAALDDLPNTQPLLTMAATEVDVFAVSTSTECRVDAAFAPEQRERKWCELRVAETHRGLASKTKSSASFCVSDRGLKIGVRPPRGWRASNTHFVNRGVRCESEGAPRASRRASSQVFSRRAEPHRIIRWAGVGTQRHGRRRWDS